MFGVSWSQIAVYITGYLVTMGLSGVIVRFLIGPISLREASTSEESARIPRFDIGTIIGKCENVLVITFILAGAYTGLALIFTAKSIVRSEDMRRDPRYFLGGTLVNFVFSVLVAFVMRAVLNSI